MGKTQFVRVDKDSLKKIAQFQKELNQNSVIIGSYSLGIHVLKNKNNINEKFEFGKEESYETLEKLSDLIGNILNEINRSKGKLTKNIKNSINDINEKLPANWQSKDLNKNSLSLIKNELDELKSDLKDYNKNLKTLKNSKEGDKIKDYILDKLSDIDLIVEKPTDAAKKVKEHIWHKEGALLHLNYYGMPVGFLLTSDEFTRIELDNYVEYELKEFGINSNGRIRVTTPEGFIGSKLFINTLELKDYLNIGVALRLIANKKIPFNKELFIKLIKNSRGASSPKRAYRIYLRILKIFNINKDPLDFKAVMKSLGIK
ncbi:MAG: hypothetical protein WC307_03270 [Candidatus Nanoarchaeia archaeon]|jgi:hypothetical protein